jgi:hypothetical protein
MALRSWWDYNEDPIAGARPTVTSYRRGPSRRPYRGVGSAPSRPKLPPASRVTTPYTNPYEIIDMLTRQFNEQPVTYSPGPRGNLIATRSMARPELPSEMARFHGAGDYFGEGDLTAKFIVPPRQASQTYSPPTSDTERQLSYNYGTGGMGRQNTLDLSPSFFPPSAFNVPLRQSLRPGASPTPEFGSTIDYTTGRFYTPPGRGSYNQPFGRFDQSLKTPPTFGAPIRPSSSSNRGRGIMSLRKQNKKRSNRKLRETPRFGSVWK